MKNDKTPHSKGVRRSDPVIHTFIKPKNEQFCQLRSENILYALMRHFLLKINPWRLKHDVEQGPESKNNKVILLKERTGSHND